MPCADVCMSVCGGKEQCTNSSLCYCWGPGQHLLTAISRPQATTKQNRRRMGQRFLNSSNEKSGVRLVHLGESSWPSFPFSKAGVHHWIPLNKPGCLDETTQGTQSCTSRLGYKEALTCSLPNKHY